VGVFSGCGATSGTRSTAAKLQCLGTETAAVRGEDAGFCTTGVQRRSVCSATM
jgi:hypothetical protein